MEPSLEEFVNLSIDDKIKVLKERNIVIHPLLWLLLKDSLINSINTIYWIVKDKEHADPAQGITLEDGRKIVERCEKFNTNLSKIQNGLLPTNED